MSNNLSEIYPLFPQVVAKYNINRSFTKQEISLVSEKAGDISKNSYNAQSNDYFVFNDSRLKELKQFCQDSVQNYWNDIIKANSNIVKPVMTQSWINYSNNGEGHQRHNHVNSFLSGVLYFSAHNDPIMFHSPVYSQLEVMSTEWTLFNSRSYRIDITTGDCVIFPSYLEHNVVHAERNYTRISIAFNILPDGQLGNFHSLTYGKIKVENNGE